MNSISSLYTDADLYDLVHLGPWKGELEFYLRQVERVARAEPQVLELACGAGRLAVPLSQRGLKMTGLDLSGEMLERAKSKAEQVGAAVEWLQGDMRSFELGRRFDLIFIPINSVCHLLSRDDFERCLACVKAHLAPAGCFVIDVFVPDLKILSRPADRWYEVGEYPDSAGRIVRLSEQNRYDAATQINSVIWRFESESGRVDHSLLMRQYFPQELEALLAYNGLPLAARYGKYGEDAFHAGSARQISVCDAAL